MQTKDLPAVQRPKISPHSSIAAGIQEKEQFRENSEKKSPSSQIEKIGSICTIEMQERLKQTTEQLKRFQSNEMPKRRQLVKDNC